MRVILDTNVWSDIGRHGLKAEFESLEDALALQIVVPPSILLEAARTPNEESRARILDALTSRGASRVHPLPEARQEAAEVVSEVQRIHPSCLRRYPVTDRVRGLEKFWTRKIWQVAARDPHEIARRESRFPIDAVEEHVLHIQEENKRRMTEAGVRPGELGELWVDDPGATDAERIGWDGDRLEWWRVANSSLWWYGIVVTPRRYPPPLGGDTTLFDWVDPWVRTDQVAREREGWNRFWYYEVRVEHMPRNWIRELLPWAQLSTKLGRGNPRDMQHASYLFDADVFVTGDRRYAAALEQVRRWTSTDFARVCRIASDGSVVSAIAEALA